MNHHFLSRAAVAGALLLSVATSAVAVPADGVLRPVKQADGTVIMLRQHGDEHFSWFTTEDGRPVIRDARGMFVPDNTLEQRRAAMRNQSAGQARRNARRGAYYGSTTDGLGQFGTMSRGDVPSIGDVTIPVIMVEFADTKFLPTTTIEKMTRYFNQDNYREDSPSQRGSVGQYFREQSRGMFNPTFDIVAKVTLDSSYAYYGRSETSTYGGQEYTSNDANVWEMVNEAVTKAVAQGVDFSDYYVNGSVPNVSILYAGPGEATGGDANTVWPHELSLAGYGSYGMMGGYSFASYFVGNEVMGQAGSSYLMGMGVFVHEFSHAMGLPDFYDPLYRSTSSPFGYSDIMDVGVYRNNSYAPVGYSAYEQSYMGWLDLRHLSDPEAVTLANPGEDPDGEWAVVIDAGNTANAEAEYYVLENRQPGLWNDLSGLYIGHYAYNRQSWAYNQVNVNNNFRAHMVTANNTTIDTYGRISDNMLYGNGINTVEELSRFGGGTLTDQPLYRISNREDQTVTFSYKDQSLKPSEEPVPTADGDTFLIVTSMEQLQDGDSIIIVNPGARAAIAKSANARVSTPVSISADSDTVVGNARIMRFAYRVSLNSTGGEVRALHTQVDGSGYYLSCSSTTGISLTSRLMAQGRFTATFAGNAVQLRFGSRAWLVFSEETGAFDVATEADSTVSIYRKKTDNVTNGISTLRPEGRTESPAVRYNLSGQRVSPSYRGIVIEGRKKVFRR